MSDTKELLQRARREFPPPERVMESLRRRRDRKRRNQRIAAGVVGFAVFVAAIWIVTTGGAFDRTESPAIPGPAETGPAVTGPVETGPTVGSDNQSDDYGFRIPPAGTAVSTPVEGELIAEASTWEAGGLVRVYADGRVLSAEWSDWMSSPSRIVERRLSPEGVELVQSGAVEPKDLLYPEFVPDPLPHDVSDLWEHAESKPWVPARYGACFWGVDKPLDVEAVLTQLPASARALLRGSDPAARNPRCLVVTPEEARSLEAILSEAGSFWGDPWEWEVGAWSLPDGNGDRFISLRPLYPDEHRLFRLAF